MGTLHRLTYTLETCALSVPACVGNGDTMRSFNGALTVERTRVTLVVAVPANRASAGAVEPRDATASEEFHEDGCGAGAARRDDLQLATVASNPWHDDDTSAAPLQSEGGAGAGRTAAGMGGAGESRRRKGETGFDEGPQRRRVKVSSSHVTRRRAGILQRATTV